MKRLHLAAALAAGLAASTAAAQAPPINNLAVSQPVFSPNGDGVKDTTTITATTIDVTWSIRITRLADAFLVLTRDGSGPSISYTWNGSGQPDGSYSVRVTATRAGQSTVATIGVTLDKTPPTAALTFPSDGGLLSNVNQLGNGAFGIRATMNGQSSWTLDVSASPPGTWSNLATGGGGTLENAVIGTFSPAANGSYTLRLLATDAAGNTRQSTVTTTVASFSIVPSSRQFDSGSGETLSYTSVIPLTVSETVQVKNASGQVVRTLFSGTRSPGTYVDTWDGCAASPCSATQMLPDGLYSISAYVSSGAGSFSWTPPGVSIYEHTDDLMHVSGVFDPYTAPLTMTPTFTEPCKLSICAAPEVVSIEFCDATRSRFLIVQDLWVPSGPTTVTWGGLDATGAPRPDIKTVGAYCTNIQTPLSASLKYGSRPKVTAFTLSPSVLNPGVPPLQRASLTFTTYQGGPADVTLTFRNLTTRSVLRTLSFTGRQPGTALVYDWDGRADNGAPVAAGEYAVTAAVSTPAGSATSQLRATVRYQ